MTLDTEMLDFDQRISMAEIKKKLREDPGVYGSKRYTAYLADRLGDELSPREFFIAANVIIREMSIGNVDPTKPTIPTDVVGFGGGLCRGRFDFEICRSPFVVGEEVAKSRSI